MAPAVHATGPRGAFTINGAQSYENLFTLDGAVINENLRGAPIDALHRRRAAGSHRRQRRCVGRIRPVLGRHRERHHEVGRQHVQRIVPHVVRQRQLALVYAVRIDAAHREADAEAQGRQDRADVRGDVRRPGEERAAVVLSARRASRQQESTRTTAVDQSFRTSATNDEKRYEGKLTYTPRPGHSLQGSYLGMDQVLKNFTRLERDGSGEPDRPGAAAGSATRCTTPACCGRISSSKRSIRRAT